MSATYIVIAIKNGCELEICEPYASSNAAFGRAFALANLRSFINKEPLIPVPVEVYPGDGSIHWIFITTNKTYVAVHFHNILINPQVSDPLKNYSHPDPAAAPTVTINAAVLDPAVTADDPYKDSLPGGWFTNNKPATMKDLWETPEQVKATYELSSAQMWALAKARISKRQNFYLDIPGLGIFNQTRAISEINNRTVAGEEVVESELAWLEELREDRQSVLFDDA